MERRSTEWIKLAIQVAVILMGLAGAYYKLDARVMIAEEQIKQETKGYEVLLKSFNDRMNGVDTKLNCLIDKRFCH